MKLLNNETLTPEFISSIDVKKNIIFSTPNDNEIIKEIYPDIDIFKIKTSDDINLSTNVEKISQKIASATIYSNIKISIPAGIKINFNNTNSYNIVGDLGDIFQKVFTTFNTTYIYDKDEKLTNIIFDKFKFVLYIDVSELYKRTNNLNLKKGTSFIECFFSWYIQTAVPIPMIDNIYLIQSPVIFETFSDLF